MTDSGKDRQEYSQRLKPLSAEEYAQRKDGEQRPTYLSQPGVDRKPDRTTYTFNQELRDRAAGRNKGADWIWLLLALLLMGIEIARQDPAERFNFRFLLNPVSILAIIVVVILAIVTHLVEKSQTNPNEDPMSAFEHRAHFNLVDRGLLRRTMEAKDSYEILPLRPGILNMELHGRPDFSLADARVRFLIANYPEICERHGYSWGLKGMQYHNKHQLYGKENRDNPYNRRLCGIIDELLSSGRY
ncbi:MAG: hypothetical protein H7A35_01810 [Planctomycetales bacterium]|nr:hypothetical protein [bacterium]UNM08794.1 MAG: hypothetical protein H7A35_01810 [Planctomycetales bacterium]